MSLLSRDENSAVDAAFKGALERAATEREIELARNERSLSLVSEPEGPALDIDPALHDPYADFANHLVRNRDHDYYV